MSFPIQRGHLAMDTQAPELTPEEHVADQVLDAVSDLERQADGYFHFPWPALDAVIGGMPGGEVCYIGAFSGHGKTTFLSSLTDQIFEQKAAKVFYMGLESRPKVLRTHWACKRLGYDAGDILSGAYLTAPNADHVRSRLRTEIYSQAKGAKGSRIRFCPTPYVTAASLHAQAKSADDFGASVFIIDHVDHIDGSGQKSAWEQSVEVNRAILEIAQEYGFLMLVATQFNLEAVKGRRVALHVAPQPTFVKMGNHKREVATWMLGLYKPLMMGGLDKDVLATFNATGDGYDKVIEPNVMAVSVMKHRFYGNREGQRALLGVESGCVVELDDYQKARLTHGIRTNRSSMV